MGNIKGDILYSYYITPSKQQNMKNAFNTFLPATEEPNTLQDKLFDEEFDLQEFMEWFPKMGGNFYMSPMLWKLYILYLEKSQED